MSGGSDPYVYPGTDTLRNLANIRDPQELATFEAEASLRRGLELLRRPIEGNFDAAHLKAIHKHLFHDVYAWAGRFRTTVLGKREVVGGPIGCFTAPHLLEHEAERIFNALHRAANLRNLTAYEFAREAALLLAALNTLHPFREGNGRTQRVFVQAVAHPAGHPLYFDTVSKERMVQASILSTQGDSTMMIRLFHEIMDAARVEPLRRAIAFLETNGFKWNETYIATTTPGQTYSGRLVGRDQDAFMMRTVADQIIIGNQRDMSPETRSGDQLSFTAHWPELTLQAQAEHDAVAQAAIAYMRASKAAILSMPITERPAPSRGIFAVTPVAQNESHVAIAMAGSRFVVLERRSLVGTFEIGKKTRIRFSNGKGTIEDALDRGR